MKAVIFDLDNCLCPADQIGPQVYEPAFAAIRLANDGSVRESDLDAAFSDMWLHAFDWVADRYTFTPAMFAAGWRHLSQAEVLTEIQGYDDLHLLSHVPAERFLVTTGFRRLQESKIVALDISKHFCMVIVDGIDDPIRKGKRTLFQTIMASRGLTGSDVLIVGDNPESELAAGKSLGLRCVQTLRPGVVRSNCADFHVHGIKELIDDLQPAGL